MSWARDDSGTWTACHDPYGVGIVQPKNGVFRWLTYRRIPGKLIDGDTKEGEAATLELAQVAVDRILRADFERRGLV